MSEATLMKKSFTGQMKSYFGLKQNQTIGEFAAELKAISHKDKVEFCEMLNAAGYPTEEPTAPAGK